MQTNTYLIQRLTKKRSPHGERFLSLNFRGSEANDKVDIVGLNTGIVCRTVAPDFTAFAALVNYHVSLFRIYLRLNRVKDSEAGVLSVARHYVYMDGTKAKRAVIA